MIYLVDQRGDEMVDLLGVVIWPLTFLLAVFVIVLVFRRPLADRIREATELKLFHFFLMKAGLRSDSRGADERKRTQEQTQAQRSTNESPPDRRQETSAPAVWQITKPANAYWLGSDLMWTVATAAAKSDKSRVEHGLRQSLHHAREISLPQSILQMLDDLCRVVGQAKKLDVGTVDRLITELGRVRHVIGTFLADQQGEFRSHPN